MHEIERRFILTGIPDGLVENADMILAIERIYIAGINMHDRFSRIEVVTNRYGPEQETIFNRTIKVGHGVFRREFEEPISEDLFKSIDNCDFTTKLEKVRCRVSHPLTESEMKMVGAHELVFEVDSFSDRKLVLAEVELPKVDSEFLLPEWLAPFVIREVTNEVEFEGVNLAM